MHTGPGRWAAPPARGAGRSWCGSKPPRCCSVTALGSRRRELSNACTTQAAGPGAEGARFPFTAMLQSQPASFGPLVLTWYFDLSYDLGVFLPPAPCSSQKICIPRGRPAGNKRVKTDSHICSPQYPKDSISHAQPTSQGLVLVHPF